MADLKLFELNDTSVRELQAQSIAVEKSLQSLIETHLEEFLNIRFLATEYHTGKTHGGRIDTLGLDENDTPVIIEYKRALNENVINQGLFYLDWLLDHKAEFTLLAQRKFGVSAAERIEWSSPRLLCIAGDYTRYDEHAIQQIDRTIELIRYRRYGDRLLLLELVNATAATSSESGSNSKQTGTTVAHSYHDLLAGSDARLKDRFEAVRSFLSALGDDVQMKTLKHYVVFKRLKNFASVEVRSRDGHLLIYVKVDPETIDLELGFTRNVRNIGHFGTGDLEIRLSSDADLEKAKPLLLKSYEAS